MNKKDIFRILLFILLVVGAVALVDFMDQSDQKAESEIVTKAVRDAVITCYAVEGVYPDDVDYLKAYYHLSYNEDRFFVTIESFSTNHFPDIYVTERGAQMQ